jgi:hypothetical protein
VEAQRTLDELAGIAVLLVIAVLVVAADTEMQRTPALPTAPVPPLTNKQRLKQLATKLHRTLRTTRALPAPVA